MKWLWGLVFVCLPGCLSPSVGKVQHGDFCVEYLFEQDGYKMYRFQDGNTSYHYFLTPGVSVSSPMSKRPTDVIITPERQ